MARTTLTKTTAPGFWSLTGVVATLAAADVANGNQFIPAGETIVIARNSGASAYTVTITSVADERTGRTGDVNAVSLAAGEVRLFRIKPEGWKQSDGYVYISANNAAVLFGILDL